MFYKQIPLQYIKYYVIGIFSYNYIETYLSSKSCLRAYQNDKLSRYTDINSEVDAVNYGAAYNRSGRFLNSLFWPATGILNTIPYIVLNFNSEE